MDQRDNQTDTQPWVRYTRAAAVAVLLFLGGAAVWLSLIMRYECDEFVFAHAAWLVSQGSVPFRDFYEHHFPLVYQLSALPMLAVGDDPSGVWVLRVAMWPVVLLALWSAWRIDRDTLRWRALIAPIMLLSVIPFIRHALQIRPDGLAFALFLGAIALLNLFRGKRRGDQAAAMLSGLSLGLACWASQKAVVYGSIFAVALAVDLFWNRRRDPERLLRKPAWFIVGFGTVWAGVATYLSLTSSWWAFYRWCVLWPIEFQENFAGFGWHRPMLDALVMPYPWLLPLAAVGLGATLLRLFLPNRSMWQPDVLLVMAFVSCVVSFVVQPAPYEYSLVPVAGMFCLFAARGFVWCADQAVTLYRKGRWTGRVMSVLSGAAILLVACHLYRYQFLYQRDMRTPNHTQRALFQTVGALTDPDDSVHDSSGMAVTRPHAYFYFYTPRYLQSSWGALLKMEVPSAIREAGCTVSVRDTRYRSLPPELKQFLREHYQPYARDIDVWGRRYDARPDAQPDAVMTAPFHAVRDGEYFLQPGSVVTNGRVWIDGQPVHTRRLRLEQGDHTVRYEGPAQTFWLLWLPRDGRLWQPVLGHRDPPPLSAVRRPATDEM